MIIYPSLRDTQQDRPTAHCSKCGYEIYEDLEDIEYRESKPICRHCLAEIEKEEEGLYL